MWISIEAIWIRQNLTFLLQTTHVMSYREISHHFFFKVLECQANQVMYHVRYNLFFGSRAESLIFLEPL